MHCFSLKNVYAPMICLTVCTLDTAFLSNKTDSKIICNKIIKVRTRNTHYESFRQFCIKFILASLSLKSFEKTEDIQGVFLKKYIHRGLPRTSIATALKS